MKSEVVLIPTYKRPEFLFCCVKRILAIEPEMHIAIFPDRGTFYDAEFQEAFVQIPGLHKNVQVMLAADHPWHGNTLNTMEAYRWAFNERYDLTYLVEDDVMVHPDFFTWHRAMQDEFPNIFASMAWVFNRHVPIEEQELFQPWFYSIGVCFSLGKLELIARHATPNYYADMQGYIREHFADSKINSPLDIEHYEQDGLIQRILEVDRAQTVAPGITKCSHVGVVGYNRGWSRREAFFRGCYSFQKRVARVERLIADPYWRMELFGRDIVEREIGHALEKRVRKYQITLPEGWTSEFETEMSLESLPDRINSVPVTPDAKIVLLS